MAPEHKAAAIAFLFHAPGLRLFTDRRLTQKLVRQNVIAVGLTLAAMAASALHSPLLILLAWLIGHFSWSSFLAISIAKG